MIEIRTVGRKGRRMIEIKCDELQKEAIIKGLVRSEYCHLELSDSQCRSYNCCADCLNENIKWILEGGE